MTGLSGRTALITCVGRRNGIAAAIAHALASYGVHIFTTYYQPFDAHFYNTPINEPEAILDDLRAQGVQALGVAADLSVAATPQHVFATALAHFGHIDILINTAAYCVNADIFSLTVDELDRHYA